MFENIIAWVALLATTENPKLPPPPTPEIRELAKKLSDPDYRTREKAQKDLIALRHDSLSACFHAAYKGDCPEAAARAGRIINSFYSQAYPRKDGYPSIYLLPHEMRFPFGVKYEKDTGEENGRSNQGWCKEMETPFDLAAYYYKKARQEYNEQLTREQLQYGHKIDEECWRHDRLEQQATALYVHDLLYYGQDPQAILKKLEWAKDKRTLHRHYGGGAITGAVPGPAVDKDEVPEGSEYRFQQWWGFGLNPFRGLNGRLLIGGFAGGLRFGPCVP